MGFRQAGGFLWQIEAQRFCSVACRNRRSAVAPFLVHHLFRSASLCSDFLFSHACDFVSFIVWQCLRRFLEQCFAGGVPYWFVDPVCGLVRMGIVLPEGVRWCVD